LSKQPKGLAYVTFAQPTSALNAYEALDKQAFQGRLVHILAAVNRKGNFEVEEVGRKKTVKDERDSKRRTMAGKEFNWSMLYMNVRPVPTKLETSRFLMALFRVMQWRRQLQTA
jgi:multiple RNA-binding domain-containing protein 1